MNVISVKHKLSTPKYKQIVLSIEQALTEGSLKKGDQLPSVNSIRDEFSLSRDTVLKALNELKTRGVIQSIAGKGYYIISEHIDTTQKVFLLFDELNAFKEDLYNAFLSQLSPNTQVDIYFHHFNYDMFRRLIYDNIGSYNAYVIMPANLKHTDIIIEKLPTEKVYILDQMHNELTQYSGIYQNFEKDILSGLNKALHLIKKYKKLIFLFQEQKQPQGMLKGFNTFCESHNFAFEVLNTFKNNLPETGDLYLIPDDRNLIVILKQLKEQQLKLGQDVGIISYNDSLLKEIVEGGITTISTDFKKMGAQLATMVNDKTHLKVENPCDLTLRQSL